MYKNFYTAIYEVEGSQNASYIFTSIYFAINAYFVENIKKVIEKIRGLMLLQYI